MDTIKFTKDDRICQSMDSTDCINHGHKTLFVDGMCKPCKKVNRAKYYADNKAKLLTKSKQKYNVDHPDSKANRLISDAPTA